MDEETHSGHDQGHEDGEGIDLITDHGLERA